jgi:hypothetical protein
MGTPFANPVVGGGGALVIPLIRSPDFSIANKTGWAIMSNGDAYFFNIVAEGSVTANTVVISGSGDGLFVYDGIPAFGNLILAIASAAGTDSFGNEYSGPGIALSVPGVSATKNNIQIRPDLGGIFIYA